MVPGFLRPSFPDAGRLVVQLPQLDTLARGKAFSGRVLNAGSGEGAFSSWIETQAGVTDIENIDAQEHPHFLEWHTDPRNHVRVGSLTSLPYADASFDAVLCTEVIEHIPDHAAATAELARVMKPGAMLMASVPYRPAPFDPNHAHADYDLADFTALLGGAGFAVEDHRLCCHGLLKLVMRYWRAPLIRFGADRTPYVPQFAMSLLAHADRALRIGKPWDLVVRARKR